MSNHHQSIMHAMSRAKVTLPVQPRIEGFHMHRWNIFTLLLVACYRKWEVSAFSRDTGCHTRHVRFSVSTNAATFTSALIHNDDQYNPPEHNCLDPLFQIMETQGTFPITTQRAVVQHLQASGFDTVQTALLFAQDFVDRPETLASVLISDFGFPPLLAHQTKAVLSKALIETKQKFDNDNTGIDGMVSPTGVWEATVGSFSDPGPINKTIQSSTTFEKKTMPLVNVKQSERRKNTGGQYEYGLPRNYKELYPTLARELDEFYQYMTEPSTSSQGEDPIRPATAKVYMTHAKLFLGWYLLQLPTINIDSIVHPSNISIYRIIDSKHKESAQSVIHFVMWLRRERKVTASYEANLLRGIIKLLKFRFSKESEEGNSAITFMDIPIIQEIRKLHRAAEQKNRNGPRSSDEQKKWLHWPEYLQVIDKTKEEMEHLIRAFEHMEPSQYRYRKQRLSSQPGSNYTEHQYSLEEVEIAQAFQRYLILAILACIPDRQRTIRELELGRTLIRETSTDCWVIKHGPDDYKTGEAYGERPPMQLAPELTPALDEFVEKWRPRLRPITRFLFVQALTGKPLTGDSVYKRVSESCYKYTGKRTNPHLLRSMIITHVREVSNASEKDLEALALFMGHSIQMQRSSYDKRTLEKKIAPAVQLLQMVNRGHEHETDNVT